MDTTKISHLVTIALEPLLRKSFRFPFVHHMKGESGYDNFNLLYQFKIYACITIGIISDSYILFNSPLLNNNINLKRKFWTTSR